MPEVPKRAFAAPSSLQRSKFTFAPVGFGGVVLAFMDQGGEKEKKRIEGMRTCVVGVLKGCLAALGILRRFVSIIDSHLRDTP